MEEVERRAFSISLFPPFDQILCSAENKQIRLQGLFATRPAVPEIHSRMKEDGLKVF